MKSEREELAELYLRYLQGTLNEDGNWSLWERLMRSKDPTIINGSAILSEQIDDVEYDVTLIDHTQWNYIERVRLAIAANATIFRRRTYRFGWRNALSAFGISVFVLTALEYGFGYHLLPVTVSYGLLILGFALFFPNYHDDPYRDTLSPFQSFSELKAARVRAKTFKKMRFVKTAESHCNPIATVLCLLLAAVFLLVLSPIILLILTVPESETRYLATLG